MDSRIQGDRRSRHGPAAAARFRAGAAAAADGALCAPVAPERRRAAGAGGLDRAARRGMLGLGRDRDPSNALFVVGFAFVLALLLHFSLAVSRLSDETKILAQQVARLDQELHDARSRLGEGESPATASRGSRARRARRRPGGRNRRRTAEPLAGRGAPHRLGVNLLYLVPGEVGGSEIYARNLLARDARAAPELELVAYVAPEALDSLRGEPWAEPRAFVAEPGALAQEAAARRGRADLAPGAAAPRPRGPAAQPRARPRRRCAPCRRS